MKRKGYTLVEIIVVLSIISIVMATSMKSYLLAKRIIDDMILKNTKAEIVSVLSLGKEYCYNKETRGRIYVNKSEGVISLVDDNLSKNKYIKKVYLPKGYDFMATFSIPISVKGVLNSETINFRDNNNEYHKITIAVGVDSISAY